MPAARGRTMERRRPHGRRQPEVLKRQARGRRFRRKQRAGLPKKALRMPSGQRAAQQSGAAHAAAALKDNSKQIILL